MQKKYQLIASGKKRADISFFGDTIAECIRAFDTEYTREGYMIVVHSENGFYVVNRI